MEGMVLTILVDYTNVMEKIYGIKLLAAQGKDKDVLILRKLNNPVSRVDGKRVIYELEYRWLSSECQDEKDESFVCVKGSENTFWSKKELVETGALKKNGKVPENINLFNCFRLFP